MRVNHSIGRRGAALAGAVVGMAWATLVPAGPSQAAAGDTARAELFNQSGARVGEVVFTQIDNRVAIQVEASGLPAGFHGDHVHDIGACTGDFVASAGGHWNPTGATHGSHGGDMPVLRAKGDGTATGLFTTDAFTVQQLLAADVAVIVHASPDNYANMPSRYTSSLSGTTGPDSTTNATGDAGGRLACGVVRAGTPTLRAGYWLGGSRGGMFTFGDGGFFGSSAAARGPSPFVGIEATPSRQGYRLADAKGGVFTHGDAGFHGSVASMNLSEAFVGIATPPYDAVAELVNAAGTRAGWVGFAQEPGRVRVSAYVEGATPRGFHGTHVHDIGACTGDFVTSAGGHWNPTGATHGSHGGDMPVLYAKTDNRAQSTFTTDSFTVQQLLDADVAVIVHASPDNYANIPSRYTSSLSGTAGPDATTNATGDAGGRLACGVVRGIGSGYWLAGARGGTFTFGALDFFGSGVGIGVTETIVGIVPTPTGKGYWLVGAQGGVYSFGDAGFFGSGAGIGVSEPIMGMAVTPTGQGYWLVGARGGVYAFGDAGFFGSGAGIGLQESIVGIRGTSTGAGYWLAGARGGTYSFGDAGFRGSASPLGLPEDIVGLAPAAG